VSKSIVALSGGIGGAKLAKGLAQICDSDELAIIANTGDDFQHFGLKVCPDIDTLIYTLAGVNNSETGWGRESETWSFMAAMSDLGGDTWFNLGDKDLAQSVLRTTQLRNGKSLSEVSDYLAVQLGVSAQVIPMSDETVSTTIETIDGALEFQQYFVRHQCKPVVKSIRFRGIEAAFPAPQFLDLLNSNDVAAFVICPSNPYLSIDPILSLAGVRDGLRNNNAPVIAVSPIVNGDSLKGPTAKIMTELGVPCSATQIAKHYAGLIDGLVVDFSDSALSGEVESMGVTVKTAHTMMNSRADRIALARVVLDFVQGIA
jgi:LPPG:FO 2-phospho-L-lactate transferase